MSTYQATVLQCDTDGCHRRIVHMNTDPSPIAGIARRAGYRAGIVAIGIVCPECAAEERRMTKRKRA